MADHGPYETWAEAHAAAVAAFPPEYGLSVLSAGQNRQLLGRALEAAGVPMGRYGDQLAEWLAGLEDAMCAEVARWVASAAQPPEGTVTEWGVRYSTSAGTQRYYDESTTREAASQMRELDPGEMADVMSRQVGPWTEAPEPAEDEDHG